jgi:hypothetical protein
MKGVSIILNIEKYTIYTIYNIHPKQNMRRDFFSLTIEFSWSLPRGKDFRPADRLSLFSQIPVLLRVLFT